MNVRSGRLKPEAWSEFVMRGALLVLTLLASLGDASAQEVILRGIVVDAERMTPVAGAFVAPQGSDRGVLTDSLGIFAFRIQRSAAAAVRVSQLGYHELRIELGDDAFRTPVTLLLLPNPVELQGLTVLTERFAERRRGIFGIAEILDRERLEESPAGSGYDLILQHVPFVELCEPTSEALCTMGRLGSDGPRDLRVCLDDRRVPGEMMETFLGGVDPRSLYMVEVFSRAGEVRMYTPGYVKRLAELGESLPPLSFGCGDDTSSLIR